MQDKSQTEMVTLQTNKRGQIYVRSQLQDYKFRGPELEGMSFIEFFIDTYEESIPANERERHVDPSAATNVDGTPHILRR